jgi:hypothetical protein
VNFSSCRLTPLSNLSFTFIWLVLVSKLIQASSGLSVETYEQVIVGYITVTFVVSSTFYVGYLQFLEQGLIFISINGVIKIKLAVLHGSSITGAVVVT